MQLSSKENHENNRIGEREIVKAVRQQNRDEVEAVHGARVGATIVGTKLIVGVVCDHHVG